MSRTKDRAYLANRRAAFNRSDTCWLCGHWIDPELKFPDPMSKSGDHVIPVSKGGDNRHGAIMVAHLDCNRKRQGKMPKLIHGRTW